MYAKLKSKQNSHVSSDYKRSITTLSISLIQMSNVFMWRLCLRECFDLNSVSLLFVWCCFCCCFYRTFLSLSHKVLPNQLVLILLIVFFKRELFDLSRSTAVVCNRHFVGCTFRRDHPAHRSVSIITWMNELITSETFWRKQVAGFCTPDWTPDLHCCATMVLISCLFCKCLLFWVFLTD